MTENEEKEEKDFPGEGSIYEEGRLDGQIFINTSSADEAIIAYAAARHVLAGTGVQDVGTSSSAIESTPEPPLTTSLPVVPVTVTSAIFCTVTVNAESTGLPN